MKTDVSLYPEKSRQKLELDYHHMVAVAWEASAEILRLEGRDATNEQVIRKLDELMRRSEDMAAKSAAVRNQRVLMTKAKPVVHVLLTALLLAGAAHAQHPAQPKPVDFALYAADATIRSLDVASTHALMASPCRCFREDDPLSPNTRHLAPLVGFQAGAGAMSILGARRLAAHGHPRLGRLLLAADIAGEVWAVQHNYRGHEATPKAAGFTFAPVPVRVP